MSLKLHNILMRDEQSQFCKIQGHLYSKPKHTVLYSSVCCLQVDFIRKNGFGGIMVWAIDLDDFGNTCGRGNYPLMTAINEALGDGYHTQMAGRLGVAKQA